MNLWSDPIEIDFPSLFSSQDRGGFPELGDKQEGICLFVDNMSYDEDILSCRLLLSFSFKRNFYALFNRMDKAINIIIENAATGQCHYMNLSDPHKVYPSHSGDNYEPKQEKKLLGIKTSYREIPITIVLDNPGWGPHLFVRAVLQNFTSNILAFDMSDDLSVKSFKDGEIYELTLSEGDHE